MSDGGSEKPSHVQKLIQRSTKHGLKSHPLYKTWKNMRARCLNKRASHYEYYGGRGIGICAEWSDFAAFHRWAVELWTAGLQIDRIDVDGDYTPANCRWVTREVNSQNRRSTKLTQEQVLQIFASDSTLSELARHYEISKSMVRKIKAKKTWKNVTTML